MTSRVGTHSPPTPGSSRGGQIERVEYVGRKRVGAEDKHLAAFELRIVAEAEAARRAPPAARSSFIDEDPLPAAAGAAAAAAASAPSALDAPDAPAPAAPLPMPPPDQPEVDLFEDDDDVEEIT